MLPPLTTQQQEEGRKEGRRSSDLDRSMGGGRRRWEDLSPDCLVAIFLRVGLDDLAVSVPFVCRSWRIAAGDPLCWTRLDFRDLDFNPWSIFSRRFSSQYLLRPYSFTFSGFLRLAASHCRGAAAELLFPRRFGASLRDLEFASTQFKRLKTLVLPKLYWEDEARLAGILGEWKELVSVDMGLKLSSSSFSEALERIGSGCRNFSSLKVTGAIKREDAAAIVRCVPALRSLNVSRSVVRAEELMEIVGGCTELEVLVAGDCFGFDADDEDLSRRSSRLRTFDVDGSRRLVCGYETDDEHDDDLVCTW